MHARSLTDSSRVFQRTWPVLLALGTAGVGVWAAFLTYVANQERLSSSVMRRVVSTIRQSPEVQDLLGEAIRPEPAWYLNGDPWVTGSVSRSSHRPSIFPNHLVTNLRNWAPGQHAAG